MDYVSQTLNVRIVYGDELKSQRVTLRPGHVELPKDRLLDLLRSVLAIRGLALVPTELPEFYRVVRSNEVRRLTDEIRAGPDGEAAVPGRVVTQFIEVPSGNTEGVAAKIAPFLSFSEAAVIELPQRGGLIVTDYEPVVDRVLRLVELVDVAVEPVAVEVVHTRYQDPEGLIGLVEKVLKQTQRQGRKGPASATLTPGLAPGTILVSGPCRGCCPGVGTDQPLRCGPGEGQTNRDLHAAAHLGRADQDSYRKGRAGANRHRRGLGHVLRRPGV